MVLSTLPYFTIRFLSLDVFFLPIKCRNDKFQQQAPQEALKLSVFLPLPPSSCGTLLVFFTVSFHKPVVWRVPFTCLPTYPAADIYQSFLVVLTQPCVYCSCRRLLCSNSLRKLSAGYNQLHKLPERVERPLLEVLDVQHNQLLELPCNLFLKSDR